eukprot:scaffold267719_cov33-Tisochrysis_lutea.AAC.2
MTSSSHPRPEAGPPHYFTLSHIVETMGILCYMLHTRLSSIAQASAETPCPGRNLRLRCGIERMGRSQAFFAQSAWPIVGVEGDRFKPLIQLPWALGLSGGAPRTIAEGTALHFTHCIHVMLQRAVWAQVSSEGRVSISLLYSSRARPVYDAVACIWGGAGV